jgi:hypothetical protein
MTQPKPLTESDPRITVDQLDRTAAMLRVGGVVLGGDYALQVVALAKYALTMGATRCIECGRPSRDRLCAACYVDNKT